MRRPTTECGLTKIVVSRSAVAKHHAAASETKRSLHRLLFLRRWQPCCRRFRPNRIRTGWFWLIRPELFRIDVGKDEMLRSHRSTRQTPQHSKLTCMSHCIGEGPLKQPFLRQKRPFPLPIGASSESNSQKTPPQNQRTRHNHRESAARRSPGRPTPPARPMPGPRARAD